MATFTPRTTEPTTDNAYYYSSNPFYLNGYGMPNCTAYAWGRFYEISGTRPKLSTGNAEQWWGATGDGYTRGQTPKLGAVICWRKGSVNTDSDGSGHVAIVEAINADGSIVTSESAWGGTYWYTRTRTNDGNWSGSSTYTFQGFIYNPVDFSTEPDEPDEPDEPGDTSNSEYIWDYFMQRIGNPYGVAGLIGNLDAESGLWSDRVQGDVPYSDYSKTYTAQVDSGAVSEYNFVHNGPGGGGYGLAQWTYYTRKQALYDMYKSGGYTSIGSLRLACDYLWYELQTLFPSVLSVLKSAKSVREASDKVLHDFENPADQSTSVEKAREALGQKYYNMYINKPQKKKKGLSLWLMLVATRRRI